MFNRNCLDTSLKITITLALVVSWTTASASAQSAAELPFDVLFDPIDNRAIYQHYQQTAEKMIEASDGDLAEILATRMAATGTQSSVSLDQLAPSSCEDCYPHMVKSTLYFGELYDCGRCEKVHAGYAGGVLISEDGLALTNYHVLGSKRSSGKTIGMFAMTYDGKLWPIKEVLAGSKKDDAVLVRLDGNGHRFHAAAIARSAPRPLEKIRIMSHPFGEFFVMTQGEISRYSVNRNESEHVGDRDRSASWMEVTAAFGPGSSGCGVFNEHGEVVGLVSTIRARFQRQQQGDSKGPDKYAPVTIRMCVPQSSIMRLFAEP